MLTKKNKNDQLELQQEQRQLFALWNDEKKNSIHDNKKTHRE